MIPRTYVNARHSSAHLYRRQEVPGTCGKPSLVYGEQQIDPVSNHAEGEDWNQGLSTDIHIWAIACECKTPVLTP